MFGETPVFCSVAPLLIHCLSVWNAGWVGSRIGPPTWLICVLTVSGFAVDSPNVLLTPSYAWISSVNGLMFLMSSEGSPYGPYVASRSRRFVIDA